MNKKFKIVLTSVFLLVLVFLTAPHLVKATVPYFLRITRNTTATSTPVFMTPGVATSTITSDIYSSIGFEDIGKNLSVALAVQLTASSTNTKLCHTTEYSNDGIDWYAENVELNINATSTIDVRTFAEHCWLFASSTPGLGGTTASSNLNTKIVEIPMLLRYARTYFYLPVGSTNGSVYVETFGKQNRL